MMGVNVALEEWDAATEVTSTCNNGVRAGWIRDEQRILEEYNIILMFTVFFPLV